MILLPPTIRPPTASPIPPFYDYTIALGDTVYRVTLVWLSRAQGWYLSLWDSEGEPLVLGCRLVVNYPIVWRHTGRKPPGQISLLDTTSGDGFGEECTTLEGLGGRWKLYYHGPEDLAEPVSSSVSIEVHPV